MKKIKKNDMAYVLSGRDRGKTGKVFWVSPKVDRALVEGIHYVKKHARKTRENQQGGIIQKEASIHISNLALFCRTCSKPSRVGINTLADGTKSRYCKRCKEAL